jgi:hypothetical protein
VKTGGKLFNKTFTPFRKEDDTGDNVMTTIIQQHNNFLRSTKQHIVPNVNAVDCLIDIATGSAEDMDAATVTLHKIFYQYKDDDGGQLFDAIEKMSTGGTYRFLFHERNVETVDNMLSNCDATFDAFGAWGDCDVHFRYTTALPISVVGRVSKSTPTAFWANYRQRRHMAHHRDQKQKREQLLVIWMTVPAKLLSKRVRTETIRVERMQPTPTRETKMM